jgi:UDP-N-acetylglucosamine--N-acetylmuramyl-(pentapeptide) pyrophosphoryl-undecaprenol N-acetylglucosamine transferase
VNLVEEIRVIFAGGGTGGHIFPAIYIAQYLKKHWDANCLFIGTKKGLENIKVSQAGFPVKYIWISGFKRGIYLSNLLFPLKIIISLIQSKKEIKQFKPDLVIGTGGYVAGSVLLQATRMKIVTAIQEQNSYPGITTRMLARRVDYLFLAYKESLNYLKNIKNYKIVGNPLKENLLLDDLKKSRNFFDLENGITTILIFGGSQGAHSINHAIDKLISERFFKNNVQIIWQTGEKDFEFYKKKFQYLNAPNIHIYPFIDRMDYAYNAADFAICRAGAMTISELAAASLPAILIPYPHAAANHQYKNALTIAQNGGALIVKDDPGIEEGLKNAINFFIGSPERIISFSKQIEKFHNANTTAEIADTLKELLQNKSEDKYSQ